MSISISFIWFYIQLTISCFSYDEDTICFTPFGLYITFRHKDYDITVMDCIFEWQKNDDICYKKGWHYWLILFRHKIFDVQ